MQLLNLISMIIPVLFLILLLFGLYKWFAGLIFIIKNLKLFKSFFKAPNWKQIIFIFFLLFIMMFEAYFFAFILPNQGCGSGTVEYRSLFKKAVSGINQAVTLNYALEGSVPLGSAEEFAAAMKKRMSVIPYEKLAGYETMKAALSPYEDKPIFQKADGIMYMFEKFEPGCKIVDRENPDNSSCIMVIDVNGFYKHNKMTKDDSKPQDRFKVIIDGNKPAVYPVHKVMQHVLYNGAERENKNE